MRVGKRHGKDWLRRARPRANWDAAWRRCRMAMVYRAPVRVILSMHPVLFVPPKPVWFGVEETPEFESLHGAPVEFPRNGVPVWLYESLPVLIGLGSDVGHREVADTHFGRRGMSNTDSLPQGAADSCYVTSWAGQPRYWETWVASVVEQTAGELNTGRSEAASRRPWVVPADRPWFPPIQCYSAE